MSGGPQVFLGATTFCLIASPPDLRPPPGFRLPPDLRPPRGLPARSPSALRASLGASSRSPARPRHRPRAPQPGPAGLAAASNRAALGMTRPPARPARPLAVRAASFARRVVSKPGRAPQASPRPLLTSLLSSPNFACNSPATLSNHEFTTLELQRFQTFSRFRPVQLHVIILGSGHVAAHRCRRSFA